MVSCFLPWGIFLNQKLERVGTYLSYPGPVKKQNQWATLKINAEYFWHVIVLTCHTVLSIQTGLAVPSYRIRCTYCRTRQALSAVSRLLEENAVHHEACSMSQKLHCCLLMSRRAFFHHQYWRNNSIAATAGILFFFYHSCTTFQVPMFLYVTNGR